MADSNEDLEPLFDYRRVQPNNFICLDDSDESPVCAAKKRKKIPKPVIKSVEDDEVEVIEMPKQIEEEEEDWLAPPPNVAADLRKQHCEDATIKKLRLQKQELLRSLAKSANEVFLATEELKRKLPDDSINVAEPHSETAAKPPSERAKIRLSIQDQGGLKQYRIYKEDRFERFFKSYAERAKVEVSKLVFTFDGDKISPNSTPVGLDMDDDDIIEVHSKK